MVRRAVTTRVAIICGAFRPTRDGIAAYTARLVRQLRGVGLAAAVLSTEDGYDTPGVEVRRVARRWDLEGVQAVARAIGRLDPDVVHVQFAPSAYRFSAAIGLLPLLVDDRRPLVTTLHEYGWSSWRPGGIPEALLRPLWRVAERLGVLDRESLLLAVRSSALVVTNNEHALVLSRRFNRCAAVAIPIGPNVPRVPVDSERARRQLRERLGAPREAQVIVFFGFVHPVKGLPYLFEALARLRSRHPDLHLVVAGGFQSLALPQPEAFRYEQELRGLLATLELTRAVSFTGYVSADEASAVLQGADIAVLPFNAGTTTKSGSLLAVLAHGLPTVATASEVPDLGLAHERNVLLVPPRDPQALEAGIERLLADPDLARRLAAAGPRLAERHDWPTIATQHARLYDTVLGRGGSSSAGARDQEMPHRRFCRADAQRREGGP